jgi:uncharacterized membrane protein
MELFKSTISLIGYGIESVGVLIIAMGTVRAFRQSVAALPTAGRDEVFKRFQHDFAQVTLVGMDFLIAGDIIRTVVVAHTIESIVSLALLVAIRTALTFTLHLELEGRWPWQQCSDISRAEENREPNAP